MRASRSAGLRSLTGGRRSDAGAAAAAAALPPLCSSKAHTAAAVVMAGGGAGCAAAAAAAASAAAGAAGIAPPAAALVCAAASAAAPSRSATVRRAWEGAQTDAEATGVPHVGHCCLVSSARLTQPAQYACPHGVVSGSVSTSRQTGHCRADARAARSAAAAAEMGSSGGGGGESSAWGAGSSLMMMTVSGHAPTRAHAHTWLLPLTWRARAA